MSPLPQGRVDVIHIGILFCIINYNRRRLLGLVIINLIQPVEKTFSGVWLQKTMRSEICVLRPLMDVI